MENIIPVVSCFNNNYAIPAGVAFYSLLKNSNTNYNYKLYVLHSNITNENQKLLLKTIEKYPNAELKFINLQNKFSSLFKKTASKAYFSEEMYYKLIIPNLFTQYDKIIVTDADVLFISDLSVLYNNFNSQENYYLYSEKAKRTHEQKEFIKNTYYKDFPDEDFKKLICSAGFMIYNLNKMRQDNIEDKWVDFIEKNSNKVWLPEQDTINIICYPNIKFFPTNTMFCNLSYSETQKDELDNNIIQLHYVGENKPWKKNCPLIKLWFNYLLETPLFEAYIDSLEGNLKSKKIKTLFSIKFPFYRKKFLLIKK